MPAALRYPLTPARSTLAYQVILDLTLGSPRVGETPTIGFPFVLELLQLSASADVTETIHLTILLATEQYVSGEARNGYIIHRVRGSATATDQRNLPYRNAHPLTLRPRIIVPQAGYRIRMVQTEAVAEPSVRGLFILTPLS